MNALNRAEMGRVMEDRTEVLVLGTAFLFLMAGSLWAHFALGPVVLEFPFLACWGLIHFGAFVTLRSSRLLKVALPLAGWFGLQLHFYSSLRNYQLPYYPMAPVFFLAATISLSAYRWKGIRSSAIAWICTWASIAYWLQPYTGADVQARAAFGIALGVSGAFVGIFLGIQQKMAHWMKNWIDGMGPRESFETQRIHASRLQSLGELAAGLVHELHNPLTSISGYSYQIDEEFRESSTPNLSLIRSSNEKIRQNVTRIMDISRAMKGFARKEQVSDQFSAVSLKEACESSLTLMRHHIRTSGIELTLQFPEKDLLIKGNLTQVTQVLVNLLSNARDACLHSERKRITLGYAQKAEQVELWVEDTGPGLLEEKQVFQAFFTTKPEGQGTGLGLYISKLIMQRHRGEIGFHVQKDDNGRILGTRFSLLWDRYVEGADSTRSGQAA